MRDATVLNIDPMKPSRVQLASAIVPSTLAIRMARYAHASWLQTKLSACDSLVKAKVDARPADSISSHRDAAPLRLSDDLSPERIPRAHVLRRDVGR
jgi:hypothetical protein